MSRAIAAAPRATALAVWVLATLAACTAEPPAPPGPAGPAALGGSSPLPAEQLGQLVDAVRQLQGTIGQLGGATSNAGGGLSQDQLKRRLGMEVEAVLDFLEDDQTDIPGKDSLASILDLVTSGSGQFSQQELDQLESDFQSFLQEVQGSIPGADLVGGGPGPGGPGPGGPGGPRPGPPRP